MDQLVHMLSIQCANSKLWAIDAGHGPRLIPASYVKDAHKSYTRTAKDLNKARSSYGELEGMVGKLRCNLEDTASSQGKDRTRIQELSEEVQWSPSL